MFLLRAFYSIQMILGRKARFRDKQASKRVKAAVSRQNGHLINHSIPETTKFDFRVILLRRIKYL